MARTRPDYEAVRIRPATADDHRPNYGSRGYGDPGLDRIADALRAHGSIVLSGGSICRASFYRNMRRRGVEASLHKHPEGWLAVSETPSQ